MRPSVLCVSWAAALIAIASCDSEPVVVEPDAGPQVGLGQRCDTASCGEGLRCKAFIEEPGICYEECEIDGDCEGDGRHCAIELNESITDGPMLCSVACDLVSGAGCAEDSMKCFAFTNAASLTFTACVPAGPKMIDEPCSGSDECGSGHLCFLASGQTEKLCLPFCDLGAPACPTGHTCEPVNPAILVDLRPYGACSPSG